VKVEIIIICHVIRFEFFVYFLMFIHLWRRDTTIMLSVSKFNTLND